MPEQWVFLLEVLNDLEAGIVCGLLRSSGIPCRKEELDALAGAMRIIGGQAQIIQILVPKLLLQQARELIHSVEDKVEPDLL